MDVQWETGVVNVGDRVHLRISYAHDSSVSITAQVYNAGDIDSDSGMPRTGATAIDTLSVNDPGDGTGFDATWRAKAATDGTSSLAAFVIVADESDKGTATIQVNQAPPPPPPPPPPDPAPPDPAPPDPAPPDPGPPQPAPPADASPTCTAIDPISGDAAGGTAVTLSGSNLGNVTNVTIGGVPLEGVAVAGDGGSITGTTGPHGPGDVDIVLSTDSGDVTASVQFTYTGSAPTPPPSPDPPSPEPPSPPSSDTTPTCTAIDPISGDAAGGTAVTLSGSNLGNVTNVTIGGVALQGVAVGSDGSSITGTTGPHDPGDVDIVLSTDSGDVTATVQFTYTGESPAPPAATTPTFTAIDPATGDPAGGTAVTITGTNLGNLTDVTVGGVSLSGLAIASDGNSITGTTGAHDAGAVDVVLSGDPSGDVTASGVFTYDGGAPAGNATSPRNLVWQDGTGTAVSNAAAGDSVTIGFDIAHDDQNQATVSVYSADQVQGSSVADGATPVATPPATERQDQSGFTAAFQVPDSGDGFYFQVSVQNPTWNQDMTPVLSGELTVGPPPAERDYYYPPDEKCALDYQVKVTKPPADSGTVLYHQGTQDGAVLQQGDLAKIGNARLNVDLSPFVASTDSPLFLEFVFTKDTDTQRAFRALALADPAPGTIDVPQSASPGDTVTFKVTSWNAIVYDTPGNGTPGAESDPSRIPDSLKAQVQWRVDGTDLDDKGEQVTFTVPQPTNQSPASEVVAFLPQSSSFPAKGTLGVLVPTPQATDLQPPTGPTNGGTSFTISGTNLQNITGVQFDGVDVTDIQQGTDGSLSGTTPPHAEGGVDVVLKGDPTGDVTIASGFTYIAIPAFSSIDPSTGSCAGGTDFKITGQNLGKIATIDFGGSPADSFTVSADGTTITGKTQPHDPGPVDITLKGDPNGDVVAAGAYTYKGIDVRGTLFYNRTWDYNTSGAIGAIKTLLVDVQVEYLVKNAGDADFKSVASVFTDDKGAFLFSALDGKGDTAKIRINLVHRSNVVSVFGRTLKSGATVPFSDAEFKVESGKLVWHTIAVDVTKTINMGVLDLTEVEVTHDHFRALCDAFTTVVFGHDKLKTLVGVDMPLCKINYPEEVISNASVEMSLQKDDLKDRDVILHEYGHFIGQHTFPGGLVNPGYNYDDNATGMHGPGSAQHYEAAWIEGHATFLSCALQDDAIYHDGYDANTTFHLDTDDHTAGGAHDEGAVQEALWNCVKVRNVSFKDGFWKAFAFASSTTIYELLDNWKSAGASDRDKLIASLKLRGMEFGYRYEGGKTGTKWTAAAKFDAAKHEFATIDELFDNFGSVAGEDAAKLADRKSQYMIEFYNRNKIFNKGTLAAGSTRTAPAVSAGKSYIVPQRFQIS